MNTTKTIRQSVVLRAPPKRIYAALMDSKKHARFTGEKAVIDGRIGGRFSCYAGYITGITLELDPGRTIVQAWRSSGWPKGYYSIVTFKLTAAGRGKTRLAFTQVGVPPGDYQAKSSGWKRHYWKPLKAMLQG
jgi:uncharacterized protein YndB with AHSA1/START domain